MRMLARFLDVVSARRGSLRAAAGVVIALSTAGCPAQTPRSDLGGNADLSADPDLRPGPDLSSTDQAASDLASAKDLSGPRAWAPVTSSTTKTLFTVTGAGGTVWAAGSDGVIVKSTGGAFAAETGVPGGATSTLFGLSATSATSAYAVGGSGTILRLSGTTWAAEAINPTSASSLSGVWAGAGGVAFASGANASLIVSNGTPPWTPKAGANHNVNGIWGASATAVYAVGQGNLVGSVGQVLYFNGTGDFTLQTVPNTIEALFAVGGSGAADVYAVGRGGVILHSTGNGTWTLQTSGTTQNLNGVGGIAGEMYVVGDAGTILVSTNAGVTWTAQNQGTKDLYGVWASATDVYAVGADGTMYHR